MAFPDGIVPPLPASLPPDPAEIPTPAGGGADPAAKNGKSYTELVPPPPSAPRKHRHDDEEQGKLFVGGLR